MARFQSAILTKETATRFIYTRCYDQTRLEVAKAKPSAPSVATYFPMPGAGLEPARPLGGHLIFRSPPLVSAYLGRSEVFLLTRLFVPRIVDGSRPVSVGLCHPP
jgi:hypothetical protein